MPVVVPVLDAPALRRVMHRFHGGLAAHRQAIDNLNVYPVPDGDTGTNMTLTMQSVTEGLDGVGEGVEPLCAAIAHGALMGARGNSGVILAQIMRGVSGVLRDAAAQGGTLDAPVVARALTAASDGAYSAVARPVEGTILTVIREASESAQAAAGAGAGLAETLEAARERGYDALRRTPQMLAVLAEAGVVDAGGAGLMLLIDACLAELDGREMPQAPTDGTGTAPAALAGAAHPVEESSIAELRYEVMFLLDASDAAVDGFKRAWAQVGDSIVVVGGDGIWNCHIHTDDIGAAVEAGIAAGRPHRIAVTDLLDQAAEHSESFAAAEAAKQADPGPSLDPGPSDGPSPSPSPHLSAGPSPSLSPGPSPSLDPGPNPSPGPNPVGGRLDGAGASREPVAGPPAPVAITAAYRCAVVAVGAGAGVEAILTSMGAGRVVTGGQSMNPSTAELVAAVDSLPAGHVVLLPNNKNIIPVAEQVDAHTEREVSVVPTRSVVEGMAALLAFSTAAAAAQNHQAMSAAAAAVTAAEVTQAVRDASSPAGPIRAGDWLGVAPAGIASIAPDAATVATALLDAIIDESHELLTVITGADAQESVTAAVQAHMQRHHPQVEVEVTEGGQPLYPYYFGLE